MYHCIIVKFNDKMKDLDAAMPRIRELFDASLSIPGISEAVFFRNCTPRPNRYDLMIRIKMDAASLPVYDESEPHHMWKNEFGPLMESKAIFDYEE